MSQVKVERVRCTRGFYANVIGSGFGLINPEDVVDLSIADAAMVRAAKKADEVGPEVKPTRASNYLPERKRNPRPKTEDLLSQLVAATASNTQAINALVASLNADKKKG